MKICIISPAGWCLYLWRFFFLVGRKGREGRGVGGVGDGGGGLLAGRGGGSDSKIF